MVAYNVLSTDIFYQKTGSRAAELLNGCTWLSIFTAVACIISALYRWSLGTRSKKAYSIPLCSLPTRMARRDSLFVRDGACFLYCAVIISAALPAGDRAWYGGIRLWSAWPWNKALTLNNYNFAEMSTYGWTPFFNSLTLGAWTAIIGTVLIFLGAYCIEKGRAFGPVRPQGDADAQCCANIISPFWDSVGFGVYLLLQYWLEQST